MHKPVLGELYQMRYNIRFIQITLFLKGYMPFVSLVCSYGPKYVLRTYFGTTLAQEETGKKKGNG